MSGFLVLKTSIIRNGMADYLTPMGPTKLHVNPIFEIGPVFSLTDTQLLILPTCSAAMCYDTQ
jgi:hypothetical protein